jgi:hypothetical protein
MHVRGTFAAGLRQIRATKLANIGKQMPTKITVQKWMVRGQTKWAVHRVEAGKRKRAFFGSKKAAEAEAGLLRSQQAAVGGAWLALPASERQRLVQVHHEAKELGVDLADLLSDWKRSPRFTGSSPALESAITEILNAKSASGRSARYVESLSILLRQFARGARMHADRQHCGVIDEHEQRVAEAVDFLAGALERIRVAHTACAERAAGVNFGDVRLWRSAAWSSCLTSFSRTRRRAQLRLNGRTHH